MQVPSPARRYDLDWLRIIAVFLLVPFHSALIFSLDQRDIVFIKDVVESRPLINFAAFLNLWHMPLLFVIAGASSWYALAKRSGGQYLQERLQRLLIPAVFGILTLIPLMTYTHYLGQSSRPSFWSYYTGYFRVNPDDLAGLGGALTPAHLWFIVFLFVFSLVGLPLFLSWRKTTGRGFMAWFGSFFSKRCALLALLIPLLITAAVPILGDKNPINYFLWFVLGFLLIFDERIQAAIDRDLPIYAVLSALGAAGYFIMDPYQVGEAPTLSTIWLVFGVLFVFVRWVWVLTILGLGHRWLNAAHPALPALSEAAFPFYILHLPVNTLIGLWIIRYPLPVVLKYGLIVLITTLACWLVYELIVRRIGVLRFLFGVKQRRLAAEQRSKPAAAVNA